MRDYHLIGYQIIWQKNNVAMYHNPRNTLNTCIVVDDNSRFFKSIRACVSWAKGQGLIKNPKVVIEWCEDESMFLKL